MARRTTCINVRSCVLGKNDRLSSARTRLCFGARGPSKVCSLRRLLRGRVERGCPLTIIAFSPPRAVFRGLFIAKRTSIMTRLRATGGSRTPSTRRLRQLRGRVAQITNGIPANVTFQGRVGLVVGGRGLLLCGMSCSRLAQILHATFGRGGISILHSCRRCLPVDVTKRRGDMGDMLDRALIQAVTSNGKRIGRVPLGGLIAMIPTRSLGDVATKGGKRCVPLDFCSIGSTPRLVQGMGRIIDRRGR